jgi:hypothetical protein
MAILTTFTSHYALELHTQTHRHTDTPTDTDTDTDRHTHRERRLSYRWCIPIRLVPDPPAFEADFQTVVQHGALELLVVRHTRNVLRIKQKVSIMIKVPRTLFSSKFYTAFIRLPHI